MCRANSPRVARLLGALIVPVLVLALALEAAAQAPANQPRPGRQEESRRKLLEQMGLEKKDRAADAPAKPPDAAAPASPTVDAGTAAAPVAAPAAPVVVPFVGRVHEALLASCRSCHGAGGMAAATGLVLDGEAARDHAAARGFVDLAAPRRSLLLSKATGVQHGGGPTIPAGGEVHRRLLQWIAAGAVYQAGSDRTAAAPPAAVPRRRRAPAPSPPAAAPPPTLPAAPLPPAASPTEAAPTAAAAPTEVAASPPVAAIMHQALTQSCLPCHRESAPGGLSRFKLAGVLADDLLAARAFLDAAASPASPLVTKAEGVQHAGGALWAKGSPPHRAALAWLDAGAPADDLPTPAPPAAGPAIAAPPAPAAPPSAPAAVAPASVARPSGAPHGRHGGVHFTVLGQELTLNGRFDLNLERRSFEGNPLADGSKTAFASYHHFVFLGRHSAEDPFVLTAELTSLEFYEAGVRLKRGRRAGVHLRAGKLLVPFGTEPLFHQSYGGHVGFDQRVLPAVWASEGLAASGYLEARGLTFSADAYGVRGHALRRPDAVLNLQSDRSPADDVRPAVGLRLGAAFAALTGYYSAYFNPLGHDRRLFLQALDLSLWRWRGLPVLDRLVLGAGALRADVSGGGAGADHYHFASYWLLRVYALDWLTVQYRQGLRTFDNKRGLVFDGRRRGPEDGSTHNATVQARYRGLSVALTYFLNLEKADEVDDDLLRLGVAYEF